MASPADLAEAFPADLAGMAFLSVAGVASPAVLAGMAVPAVAGVASPAVLAGMAVPAVAGVASLAVVDVATYSTDRMEAAGSLIVCSSRSVCDCLNPDGYVTDSDAVVLPDGVELGNPTIVALPTTGVARPVAAGGQRDPDLVYSDRRTDSNTWPEGWTCHRTSKPRYCTTQREMLAAVSMCTHFRSYHRGAQFTLRTDHRSL